MKPGYDSKGSLIMDDKMIAYLERKAQEYKPVKLTEEEKLEDYVLKLERQWQAQPRLQDKELLKVFPEVKQILPIKILELMTARKRQARLVEKHLGLLQANKKLKPLEKFITREWVKATLVAELMTTDSQLTRLKRFRYLATGRKPKNGITDGMIEAAKNVPIEGLIKTSVRVSGRRAYCLCPLHEEKAASFCIYLDQNSWHCFGCSEGGDSIDLVRKLFNYSFPEAVEYLAK